MPFSQQRRRGHFPSTRRERERRMDGLDPQRMVDLTNERTTGDYGTIRTSSGGAASRLADWTRGTTMSDAQVGGTKPDGRDVIRVGRQGHQYSTCESSRKGTVEIGRSRTRWTDDDTGGSEKDETRGKPVVDSRRRPEPQDDDLVHTTSDIRRTANRCQDEHSSTSSSRPLHPA